MKLTKAQEKRIDEKIKELFFTILGDVRYITTIVKAPRIVGREELNKEDLNNELAKGLKQCLAEELSLQKKAKKAPMGVSQWETHGKKYDYWKYFEEKIKKEIIEELEEMKVTIVNTDDVNWNNTIDRAIKTIK